MREIWESFKQWILHKLNPHCYDCVVTCQSCDTLRTQLEIERAEKKELLQHILELSKPIKEEPINLADFKPAGVKFEPWSMKRARLEQEDREKAKQIKLAEEMSKLAKLSTEELEKAIAEDVHQS